MSQASLTIGHLSNVCFGHFRDASECREFNSQDKAGLPYTYVVASDRDIFQNSEIPQVLPLKHGTLNA